MRRLRRRRRPGGLTRELNPGANREHHVGRNDTSGGGKMPVVSGARSAMRVNALRAIASRVALVVAVLVGTVSVAGAQQSWPARPITVIVPFAAGGPTDVLARMLGQHMSQTLGQQLVVENVTGAGGSIGAARVAKAAPDGYTMVMGNLGTHAAAVGLYKNLSYDPRVDFEPVMLVATTPMVLVVRKTAGRSTR